MSDSTIRQPPSQEQEFAQPKTVQATGYQLALNVDLHGVKREQLTMMHLRSGLHEFWPDGLLGHLTNYVDDGAHTLVIWNNEAEEREYFNSTAVDMITESVPALIEAQPQDPLGNFEFERSAIHRLTLTTECRAFADIGEDQDHSSIGALGSAPVLVRTRFTGTSASDYDDALAPLEYDRKLPDGMILQLVELNADALTETQLWRSEARARAELDSRYMRTMSPLLAEGAGPEIDLMSRISFGAKALDRLFEGLD